MPKKIKVTKLSGDSTDPQAELLARLKKEMPEIFTEGKVDSAKLKATLGEESISTDPERYGLSWTGKSGCYRAIQEPTMKTLHPDRKESVNFDESENVFIEGDNLEVLKTLQKSYHGKVKMIYIDPPYNTGNDFIYNDKFSRTRRAEAEESGDVDEDGNATSSDALRVNTRESGHYHSDWLNMIYPRLFIARSLLRDDGVIFVSIDDNEVANLRKVMDEIFGEENFVAQFVWRKKRVRGRGDAFVIPQTEYILCYCRDVINIDGFSSKDDDVERFKLEDIKGKHYLAPLEHSSPKGAYERKTLQFDLKIDGKDIFCQTGQWLWSRARIDQELENNNLEIQKDRNDRWRAFRKIRPTGEITPISLINEKSITTNQGSAEIAGLLGGKFFEFPKPVNLIEYLISFSAQSDDIILDFFAGSGTTAHAVMQLNAEDGGNRKWICVQLPEECDPASEAAKAGYKTIADICKERIRRAGKKIKEEVENEMAVRTGTIELGLGKDIELEKKTIPDIGFKAFRLDESNFKPWNTNIKDEKQLKQQMLDFVDNLKPNANDESLLYEMVLKSGFDLNVKLTKKKADGKEFVIVGDGSLIICLTTKMTEALFSAILAEKPQKIICFDRAFAGNDQLKTNLLLQAEDAGVQEVGVI